ncbi:bilirubin oxidase [Colletotrichum tofieldiae]|uniref:Bilirubin oxidase n=1 Tax=Colletotrichum tofieldiae TaxID=708197 RepID=A0A161VGB8_9PEZI|nr:bilirubin oxidase [Colletotrichum tofieldiae]
MRFGLAVATHVSRIPEEEITALSQIVEGRNIWYYELDTSLSAKQIIPTCAATLVSYDGTSPGATLIIPGGTESVIRFINNAAVEVSVHLLGVLTPVPQLVVSRQTSPIRESKRTTTIPINSLLAKNVQMGEAESYLIEGEAENALDLPSDYGVYEIPLILSSKRYNDDGTLFSTKGETDNLWGDVIHVND